MNQNPMARMGALLVAVLLTAGVTSCANDTSSTPPQGKRLTNQGPCDLANYKDLEKIFGVIEVYPPRQGSPADCGYSFDKGYAYIKLATESAQRAALTEIDGVTVKEKGSALSCDIDVWLAPGDIRQEFSVSASREDDAHCDAARATVRAILNSLSG